MSLSAGLSGIVTGNCLLSDICLVVVLTLTTVCFLVKFTWLLLGTAGFQFQGTGRKNRNLLQQKILEYYHQCCV